MSLTTLIKSIESAVCNSKPISEIRPLFFTLCDQAQALEAELREHQENPKIPALEARLDSALQKIKEFEEREEQKKRDAESTQAKMLTLIREHPERSHDQIAGAFNIRNDEMMLLLEEAARDGLIQVGDLDMNETWSITDDGLRWLRERDLLR